MPAPRWLARFNLQVTNPLLGPLARHMPGMGVVVHVGRKTHRQYRTPVLVFLRGERLIIALTYGREAQWIANILAENGCSWNPRAARYGSRILMFFTTRSAGLCRASSGSCWESSACPISLSARLLVIRQSIFPRCLRSPLGGEILGRRPRGPHGYNFYCSSCALGQWADGWTSEVMSVALAHQYWRPPCVM
jgi:hypothetical protein